jgi:hypothetical protein
MMIKVDQCSGFIARDVNLRTYTNWLGLDFSTPENSIRQQMRSGSLSNRKSPPNSAARPARSMVVFR